MNAVPHHHQLDLLALHCASLDPPAATARDRLDEAIGPELARKLVFALSGRTEHRVGPGELLEPRAVFAA